MPAFPRFRQDPRDNAFVQDPYPAYDRIRALGPLVWWEDYGFPVTARHEVISRLLRDRRLGRDVAHVASLEDLGWPPIPEHVKPFYAFEKGSMLEAEPPVHTRLRGLVNRAFVSRAIEGLRPGIAALCHDLIDGFAALGATDLLETYATPLPVSVIADLVGLPRADAPLLLDWSHRMVAMYQFGRTRATEDAAVAATREFSAYVGEQIAARRRAPADDLMSMLIAARDAGDRLSEPELVTTIILLMNAGHEATVSAIANGVAALLRLRAQAPDLWATVASALKDPAGAAAIGEETLRHDPPLHLFTRYALEATEIEGRRFAVGDRIGLLLAAGNRDPAAYQSPDAFHPGRFLQLVPAALGFGAGIHFCIGAPLARLELALALPILFERLPELESADVAVYRDSYHFHGLQALNVRWR